MSEPDLQKLRERCSETAADGRFDSCKVSLAFDNPQAREAHDFPVEGEPLVIFEVEDASPR